MEKHTTIITSDEPVRVEVHTDGRWFRMFTSLVESGTWARMSDAACRVYVALAKHCDQRWMAWPSLRTLVRLSGVKERAVCYAVDELQREGLLQRRRGGGRMSTMYELLEVAATPTLPFPGAVRGLSALHRDAEQQCTGVQSSPAPGCRRTRPVNKTTETTAEIAAVVDLVKRGVEEGVALDLVRKFGVVAAKAAVKKAERQAGKLRNAGGFIRSALERGFAGEAKQPAATASADGLKRFARIQAEASQRAADAYYSSRSTSGSTSPKPTP
jgi:hypothetical protein